MSGEAIICKEKISQFGFRGLYIIGKIERKSLRHPALTLMADHLSIASDKNLE